MARTFATPTAFKASLEARLKTIAAQRNTDINSLRLKLVMERLLARLFSQPDQPWVLKGGYAMELRFRPRARTTRDIDLTCASDDLLAFADILPAKVLALPKPQQFAEKIHAYTKPWSDRENMRTKDLVDLVLMIETNAVQPEQVAVAARRTFSRRNTHPLPTELIAPPVRWADEFKTLAAEARITANALDPAFRTLVQFWRIVNTFATQEKAQPQASGS